ncbi:MAG: Vitamin epoxide reductase family protein [Mucilaginibacter sp.]|nr:Vitamin epoxide reductase family protein [Mucilaginibacter sp.]
MTEKDNATRVLIRFIAELAVPVTRQSISDELQKHPDYYSLLAFSDVLNNYQVSTSAYRLTFDQLPKVPLPFITYLSNKNYAVVTRLDEKQVTLSNDRWNNKILPLAEFKNQYGGAVLVAEKQANAGEADYAIKHRKELINRWLMRLAFAGLAVILIAFFLANTSYLNTINLQIGLLTLFKTTGLATSVLLLVQSIDANNPLIQKLCGGDNNGDCNAILSSKAAKIGGISWSEIGFFYFAGTWLVLLLNSDHPALMQALAVLNLITLPYTIYSIHYQWRIAKQWCTLCCTVQAILWLEFFAFLRYLLTRTQMPHLTEWGSLIMGMMLPVFLWIISKPYFLQLTKVSPLIEQLRKFKYNKELFDAALKVQPKYAVPAHEWSIVLGNLEASNVITMVSNPYCQPCAKVHSQLDEALDKMDDMQVRVVFVGKNNSDENDENGLVHRHLMALNELPDKTIVKNALHDWYEQKQKSYEVWAKKYPIVFNPSTYYKLDKQKAWVELAEITATPTLLINGHRLPQNYQLHELKYMLD